MERKLLGLKGKLFMVMGIMLCFICFTRIAVNAAELGVETFGDTEETVQLMQENTAETVISAEERERSVFFDGSRKYRTTLW